MKRLSSISFAACLLFAAGACSSELDPGKEDAELNGVTIQIEDYSEEHVRILVHYADKSKSDGAGEVWLIVSDETELLKKEGRSIQRVGNEALRIGQEVRAWTLDVWAYSNPPQAGARRVLIEKE